MDYIVNAMRLKRGKSEYAAVLLVPRADKRPSMLVRSWENPTHGRKSAIWVSKHHSANGENLARFAEVRRSQLDKGYRDAYGPLENCLITLHALLSSDHFRWLWEMDHPDCEKLGVWLSLMEGVEPSFENQADQDGLMAILSAFRTPDANPSPSLREELAGQGFIVPSREEEPVVPMQDFGVW